MPVAYNGLAGIGNIVEYDDDVLEFVVLMVLHDEGRNRQH